MRNIRERLVREDGVAALEFAIVATVFLVILYGIMTYGFIFGLDQSLNHAAEEGARSAISQTSESAAITYAQTTALNRLSWLGARIQPSDVVATVADCGVERCITVTITYPWNTRPIVPDFIGIPTPATLSSVAVIELT